MRRLNMLFFAGNLVLLMILGFHAFPTAQAQNGTVEGNIAQAERYINNIWNQEDTDYAREYFTLRTMWHPPDDGPEQGSFEVTGADLRNYIKVLDRAFPDFQVTTNTIVANEEFVVIQYTFRGTYELNLPPAYTPFPPTGEEVVWDGVFIHRFEEGRVAEAWWYWDNHTLVGQSLPEKLQALEATE